MLWRCSAGARCSSRGITRRKHSHCREEAADAVDLLGGMILPELRTPWRSGTVVGSLSNTATAGATGETRPSQLRGPAADRRSCGVQARRSWEQREATATCSLTRGGTSCSCKAQQRFRSTW
jgi:hypothetical protein